MKQNISIGVLILLAVAAAMPSEAGRTITGTDASHRKEKISSIKI